MKVAVCTVAYREERFIRGCIQQFKGKVDHHLVLHSFRSWADNQDDLDKTVEIANEEGVDIISGSWESEAEQRNFGQRWLSDYDWILIVDADERYTSEDIDRWLDFLKAAKKDAYGSGYVVTYWKDWSHRIEDPDRGLITSVRPKVQFTHLRCIDTDDWGFLPEEIVMHHGSYVRTNEEMKKKLDNFGHASELVPGWYEDVWLRWSPEMTDLHPVNPESWQRVVPTKAVVDEE